MPRENIEVKFEIEKTVDMKFNLIMWLLVHAFIFSFLLCIYICLDESGRALFIQGWQKGLLVFFLLEFTIIGFIAAIHKMIK